MPRADFITSIVLIALGAGALVQSARMPRLEHLNVNPYTVPGIVPAVLSAVLLILGTTLLIRSILRGGWRIDLFAVIGAFGIAGRRLAVCLVLTIGYAAGLVGNVPYWLATAIFVVLFIALFEWVQTRDALGHLRAVGTAAVQAVVVAALVTAVFEYVFLVRLP